MIKNRSRNEMRIHRHRRLRKRLAGTLSCPRFSVFRSLKHIYAQIIDDEAGNTIVSASTIDKSLSDSLKSGSDVEAAKAVGRLVAERAISKGISTVVFDRGGHLFQGRVKALADAAREAGLNF
ncbi:MAG: 50S ribosomal protein L18 [Synergistaceae bacterium]|jgi:large subunit ribosomal protein L18|nr:50S ribosomal protein L18 [Synergistaceae bacterium]